MKLKSLNRTFSLRTFVSTIGLILLLSLGTIQYIVAQTPQYEVSPWGFVKTASYIITKSGSAYYAVDGLTGTEYGSNSDFDVLFNGLVLSAKKIFIAAGTYNYDSSLLFNAHGRIVEGEGLKTILSYTGSDYAIKLSGAENIQIRDLKITLGSSAEGGIFLSNVFYCKIVRALVYQNALSTTQIGVCIDGTNGATYWNQILYPLIRLGGTGIKITGSANANEIQAAIIRDVKYRGIDVDSGQTTSIIGGIIESSADNIVGLQVNDDWTDIHGLQFELVGSGANAYNITSNANNIQIFGGRFNVAGTWIVNEGANTRIWHNKYQNTVSFSSISNGSYIAHNLIGLPNLVSITLSVQGYAWYGAANSTHVQVYASVETFSGSMYCEYAP